MAEAAEKKVEHADLFEDYFTEEQVAKLMGITVGTLRNRIYAEWGHPPYVRNTRSRIFLKEEVRKWAKANQVEARRKKSL